jgi:hypothetical protein
MKGDLLAMRDWLIGQGITVVGMKATGAYWKPVFYLLESQMTCWMLNLIKVQQACVCHRRGLRTPPPWAASTSCNPSSMAAPVPGIWNAATATSLSSPARPAVLAAQTRANGDSNWTEGATDDYVYRHFEPRHGRAREELAGLGLLDQALALDLCKPPEYFHRIWSTASRANDRAAANPTSDDHAHNVDDEDTCA